MYKINQKMNLKNENFKFSICQLIENLFNIFFLKNFIILLDFNYKHIALNPIENY